jgi:Lrp/AsnC family leucine-responsive transcriptional regulator
VSSDLDDLDRMVLRLLAEDGRRSYTDLAKDTGLSTSAVLVAGLPLTAFVSVTPIDPGAPDDAPERLCHLTAIEACHSVAGDESYILKVRVGDPAELEALLQEIRAAAGVRTRTTVVLSTPWEGRTPPPSGD